MGLWGWIKRTLGDEEEPAQGVKYVLKRQKEEGTGMIKVMDLGGPSPIEELFPHLEPGIYALHKYQKGQSGFTVVWGPVEVEGERRRESTQAKPKAGGSAMSEFAQFARGLAELKESAQAEFNAIAPFFGVQTGEGGPKSFIEEYREAKAEFQELSTLFGSTTGGLEAIKYKGEVPIYLHPQLIPELIDSTMDKLERRLMRWGLVESEDSKEQRERDDTLPEFPDKPRSTPEPTESIESEVAPVEPTELEEDKVEEPETEESEDEEEEEESEDT